MAKAKLIVIKVEDKPGTVVDCWRSLCVRATLTGGGAANRPAQVFDLADMEQVDAGGNSWSGKAEYLRLLL